MLRGGKTPNYDVDSIESAAQALANRGIDTGLLVDCSHGNSGKSPMRQGEVARQVLATRLAAQGKISGIMLESHLVAGR